MFHFRVLICVKILMKKLCEEMVAKWSWQMNWCKNRGLAPAQTKPWKRSEEEWKKHLKNEGDNTCKKL